MEDKKNEQRQQTETGHVRTADNTEDVSNPVNSGGNPTTDTENKAAVAQTRNPTSRTSGPGAKTFITGSDSDGQL
ncbi:MAG: hypothetical protein EOO14_22080 [Chitinophagaceae bacterium]|nr:hypothetical protein [Flavisolibacter longurius]RYZ48461.1 MAG: hypothetical protein EOO14_22080 [Chitinophagaceae bacterium]